MWDETDGTYNITVPFWIAVTIITIIFTPVSMIYCYKHDQHRISFNEKYYKELGPVKVLETYENDFTVRPLKGGAAFNVHYDRDKK